MTAEPSLKEKIAILHRNGFLRDQDRDNTPRVLSRWRLYQTVPQLTVRVSKAQRAQQREDAGTTNAARRPPTSAVPG